MALNRNREINRINKALSRLVDNYNTVGKLKEQDELDRIERTERRKQSEKPSTQRKPYKHTRTKPTTCFECPNSLKCQSNNLKTLTQSQAIQYAKDCRVWNA